MSLTPILTDTLIAAILLEQRRDLRPPSGWGYAAWPHRAEAALATLTPDGWCNVGWIERGNHRRVKHPPRFQIWWQVDTGEVRRSRVSDHRPEADCLNATDRARGQGN